MPRTKRSNADYFPRDVQDGDSMAAVELLYGNDGYTLWGKTLQALAGAKGHYLTLSVHSEMVKFAAASRVSVERAEQIINLFTELEMIDAKLWHGSRVIWSQNLVNRLQPLYKKRARPLPVKPTPIENIPNKGIDSNQNNISAPEIPISAPDINDGQSASVIPYPHQKPDHSPISASEMPQSIIKVLKRRSKESSKDKNPLSPIVIGDDGFKLAAHLKQQILVWKPNAKLPASLTPWAHEADLMLRLDPGRTFEQAIKVMDWATADSFWRSNILSMATFRKQYDRLEARMGSNGSGKPAPLPAASEPKPDLSICAKNVRQDERGKRWCELEDSDDCCEFAYTAKCRKLDGFPGVPRKDKPLEVKA